MLEGLSTTPQVPIHPAHGHRPGPEKVASNYLPTDISPEQVVPFPVADAPAAKPFKVAWEKPESLLAQLRELTTQRATRAWAAEACRLVERLGPAVSGGSEQTYSILRRLDELASEATPLAGTLNERAQMRKLLRAACALKRRLGVWRHVVQYGIPAAAGIEDAPQGSQRLALALAEIDAVTADSTEGKAWREFLLIDALRELSAENRTASSQRFSQDWRPGNLARRALQRLSQTALTSGQREFVASKPVTALQAELRRLAIRPVDSAGLLTHIERYERTRLVSNARQLAEDRLALNLSPDETKRRLAGRLNVHYRNANVRIAVAGDLLNRLLPQREPEHAPVRDTVLGTPVRGNSVTSTKVKVRLLPDPNRVRLALEINGTVSSLTRSSHGPATFYNDGDSCYTARKPLEIDLRGIHLSPAEVEVHHDTRLRGVRTNFDPIPLVGPLFQEVARSQHEKKQPAFNQEVRRKVAYRARGRIDSEAEQRLGELARRLRQQVLEPVEALALEPTVIRAQTTPRRFIMRLRLAGEDQLGGSTPRPMAPGDSLASFQVHETALNNVVERLALAGRTFTLPDLSRHVAGRLNRPAGWKVRPADEDVIISFAKEDPVNVRCKDGRVTLILSIARLQKPPRTWKNFRVRVNYRPRTSGRSADLVRDGIIHLAADRLSIGSQVAIRGVFARIFSKQRSVELTPKQFAEDRNLADLAVTQFTIDEGWIAIAYGPQRLAWRPDLLRR